MATKKSRFAKFVSPIAIGTTFLFITGCYQGESADLIVHNAVIYSCDENFTVYEAMAIRDGEIVQLGPNREILNGYDCDNIVDAGLMPVYPGFHDAHCHFQSYANNRTEVDMSGCKSFDEVISRVVAFANRNQLPFITGRGWDQTKWTIQEFPVNDTLNKLFPDIPVLLRRVDGHAALANQKALDLAGLIAGRVIDGGFIGVSGEKLTGLLLDNAFDTVASYFPTLSVEDQMKNLKDAEYELFQVGLTSINDAGIEGKDREHWIEWYRSGELRIKNYSMLFPDDNNIKWATENGVYEVGNLAIRSFKMVADGAMGSSGACLIQPYSDSANYHGFMLRDIQQFREIAELAKTIGYQVNTHCIGDSAVRSILNVYVAIIGDIQDHRWKIEHAQLVHPDDFRIFRDSRIVASVQPTHCTSDMGWLIQRLGPERSKYAYAWKTLLENCGRLPLGTDFPVEDISPMKTFYAAITRQDAEGNPAGGFYFSEALSRKEALLGMTLWPAWSNFEDKLKGSLEPGKSADFVFLTKDIMTVPAEEILSTYVERTFLQGEEVFYSE